MLKWWKPLTQDNKLKLIGIVLAAALSAIGYLGIRWFETTQLPLEARETKATITQTTSGNHSPAISGTKGDVTININDPESTQ